MKKPHLLKLSMPLSYSFILKGDVIAWDNPWHFHPEVELLYCIKGRGTNFVGDSIRGIEEGEVLLFGSNLPHTRQRDRAYYLQNPEETPETIVVQFREDFLGEAFFQVPEFLHIKDLLIRAQRGIKFLGKERVKIAEYLERLVHLNDTARILALLEIFDKLARCEDILYLNHEGYESSAHEKSAQKINRIYQFTIEHFREDISLATVASLVNLSEAAFCRYFKSRSRKTYFEYLSEVRVGYACKLLGEADWDIGEVCYASGFNNLSHFHKQFKKITGMTPGIYREKRTVKITS